MGAATPSSTAACTTSWPPPATSARSSGATTRWPLATRALDEPTGPVTVVGCLCTPLDLLGDEVDLPGTEVGDLVVVFQAGAYGLTASPTAFLGHPSPSEVLV